MKLLMEPGPQTQRSWQYRISYVQVDLKFLLLKFMFDFKFNIYIYIIINIISFQILYSVYALLHSPLRPQQIDLALWPGQFMQMVLQESTAWLQQAKSIPPMVSGMHTDFFVDTGYHLECPSVIFKFH